MAQPFVEYTIGRLLSWVARKYGWYHLILMITSVIGLFYYLRIVVALFADLPQGAERTAAPPLVSLPLTGTFTLAALAILLV